MTTIPLLKFVERAAERASRIFDKNGEFHADVSFR